jgi:hypothetical protein
MYVVDARVKSQIVGSESLCDVFADLALRAGDHRREVLIVHAVLSQ